MPQPSATPQSPPGIEIRGLLKTDHCRVYYRAQQQQLNRPVLLMGLAPGVLASSPLGHRLEVEAKVLADLDHPNIVRLFDFVRSDDHVWLVLEDVDGPGLNELLGKSLSWQALTAIGLDVCRALSHAHRLDHFHGSLTCNSVQFSRQGRTKLSGFGRTANSDSDQVEVLDLESRGGLAPETSIGQAHSALSDLFALGALLYELASGQAPFGDVTAVDYPARVRNSAHEPLIKRAPHLPHALSSLIEQMLEKLPPRRPAHAASVAEQLEALIGGATLPILAVELEHLGFERIQPPHVPFALTVSEPSRSTWLPHRWLIPLLVGLLVVAGAVIVALSQNSSPVRRPRQEAKQLPIEEQTLRLRVVASPWARVFVDGVLRETTPFAHPISVEPGSHVVRLEHPNAPAEERTVTGQAGQVVLLNVQMHVKVELPSSLPVGEVSESSP